MPRDVLHFFLNVVEVLAVLIGLLAAGLLVTIAGLWLIPKLFGVTPETLDDDPNVDDFRLP